MQSDTLETLFGGAAGGGKSHGQLLDALRFAVCYPGSRQLMLRRTMPELERSLVPAALRLYPQCIAKYKVVSTGGFCKRFGAGTRTVTRKAT
ncbi:MAG: hypothetical protein ACLSF2_05060 [Butyricicoccus sp.]